MPASALAQRLFDGAYGQAGGLARLRAFMRNLVFAFVVLAALWLVLSGIYKPLLVGLGLGSVLFTLWIALRMDLFGNGGRRGLALLRWPAYLAWLLWQIVQANLHVARLVFQPRRIAPCVLKVPVSQASDFARATYANSVTLTPGTVSLMLDRDVLTVHALDRHAADELLGGEMGRRVCALEDERP
jgi:multicomponent Na+:H+ antiporter subunit E